MHHRKWKMTNIFHFPVFIISPSEKRRLCRPPFLIQLFIQDNDSVLFGAQYLKYISFFYPFLGINFILNGIVRASGAMFQVLVLNIISFWILRYPLTFLLSGVWGEIGIAFGMGISFVISSLVAFLYYQYGNWKKKELFDGKEANAN